MSNKSCPWSDEEIAALTLCAQKGATDVEAAEAVALAYTSAQRRTPHACRDKAQRLGLSVIWTTRPATLIQGHKAQYGFEDENRHVKDEREDKKFAAAMAKAGYAQQEPSRDPGTDSPQTIGQDSRGNCSSSAGWI